MSLNCMNFLLSMLVGVRMQGWQLQACLPTQACTTWICSSCCGASMPLTYNPLQHGCVCIARGQDARLAAASMFAHPGLYTPWAVQPLTVAWAPNRFAKCEMSASLLSNDKASLCSHAAACHCTLTAARCTDGVHVSLMIALEAFFMKAKLFFPVWNASCEPDMEFQRISQGYK